MDSSKKPKNENPGKKASPLSRLFILWIVPLLFRGHRTGLNADDLCKCIDADVSEALGDKLQREWNRELETSRRKRRPPKLRTALFKTFYKPSMFDAFLVFLFILIKSFSPLVLSQLLIQFQQPSSISGLLDLGQGNASASLLPNTNGTWTAYNNVANGEGGGGEFNRSRRGLGDNEYEGELPSNHAPGYIEVVGQKEIPFYEYAWNDVYWLSAGVVLLAMVGCFLMHHADLRQRMLGAQIRIACCSLMYRKTLKLSKRVAGTTPTGYLVNLLSNDVARFDVILILVHYAWLLPFQAVLICYLIWRKIGVAAIAGVVSLLLQTVPVQTRLSRLSAKLRMKVAQRTDKRVSIMNELIQGIQVIKMYAWEIPFQKIVAEARRLEIKQIRYASYIRAVYFSTMIFTERMTLLVTLLACVLLSKPITADIVFSSAQYFNILQLTAAIFYPLAVSLVAEGLVSIKRVEQYLMQEEQEENGAKFLCNHEAKEVENIVAIQDVSATWEVDEKKPKTLDGILLNVKPGSLCAIIGQVGAGKSSILHLLLGEMPIVKGTVQMNGTTSYGSQEPWLFPGTIRSNILFGQEFDRKLYHDVISHCALTTDFVQLPDGDKTIVGERGAALSGGQKARISLARAVYKRAQIYLLDDPLSAVDAHVGRHLFDEVIGPQSYLAKMGKTRILVTHQVHFLKDADWIVILDKGRIMYQGTYKNVANSKLDLAKMVEQPEEEKLPFNEIDNVHVDGDEDGEDIPFIDGYVGPRSPSVSNRSTTTDISDVDENDPQAAEEEKAEGNISIRVWLKYFRSGGTVFFLLFLAGILVTSQVITSGSDYFVNYWTQQEFLRSIGSETTLTTESCLYIYGLFIMAVIFMTIVRGWMFFNLCMRASKNLHNRMFESLMRTTMRFFDINPSGRILNRFSRDMGAIDELLPKAIMDSIQILLVMVGILITVSVINPILLVALSVAIVAFALVLKLYLRPAQDLKRLEGICRSPVFSHMSSSLSGLSTIRANNAQGRIVVEFDNLQDVHSSVWRLNVSSNTALGVWLDCISTAFVAAVTFSFIALHHKTFSGNVGLAISQALVLTGMVQYGVRMCCESIQHMTSVERVLQYIDVPAERNPKTTKPSPKWPQTGRVQFKNMFLKYDESAAPVLKNLNLDIEPGWKVGVVGRTGAGKSSLISALFRLSPIEGSILIDGVDTATIDLETLRKSISIIPQDPVLFSATLRYNLDPFNLFDDTALYQVLGEVELKGQTEGLDFMVTESGSNFSVGQRQLICLARAILRNSKILVLDEATANVDPNTDALIQRTIREKFKACTVLTVAHRLHTVMDSDRILVMDAGCAKEFGVPHELLGDTNGMLRSIVDATGHQESESLKRIAEEKFKLLRAEVEEEEKAVPSG